MYLHTIFFQGWVFYMHCFATCYLTSKIYSGKLSTCLCFQGSLARSGGLLLRHSSPFELFQHPLRSLWWCTVTFSSHKKQGTSPLLKAIQIGYICKHHLLGSETLTSCHFPPFFKFQVEVWCWISNVARGCLQGPQAKTVAASSRGDPQVLLRTMATYSWHLSPAEKWRIVPV